MIKNLLDKFYYIAKTNRFPLNYVSIVKLTNLINVKPISLEVFNAKKCGVYVEKKAGVDLGGCTFSQYFPSTPPPPPPILSVPPSNIC